MKKTPKSRSRSTRASRKRTISTTDAAVAMSWLRASLSSPSVDPEPTSHATIASCVRILAQSYASLPWKVYKGNDDDKEEVVDGTDPWYRLLSNPSPWMTCAEVRELLAAYVFLTGECNAVLLTQDGDPVGPEEMPAFIEFKSAAEVRENLGGGNRLVGWTVSNLYGSPSRDVPLHALVMYTDMRDPAKPWRGLSRLTAAMQAARMDRGAKTFNESFYSNSADPGGVISGKDRDLTVEQAKEVSTLIRDGHQGAAKAHKMLVLPSGLSYQQLVSKHTDMAFIQGLEWNRAEIAMVFGVPLFLLGVSQDAGYNTARHQKRVLLENTVLPLARKIEDITYARLIEPRLPPRDIARNNVIWLEHDTGNNPVLQDDLDVRLSAALKARDLGAPYNEVVTRFDLGLEQQPKWGDVSLIPPNLAPAEEVANPPEPEPVPAALEGAAPLPGQEGDDEEPEEDPKAEETDNPDNGKEPPQRSRAEDDGIKRREARWRAFDKALRPYEKSFRGKLSRYVNERRAEVLAAFAEGERAVRSSEDVISFLDAARTRWDTMLKDLLSPLYLQSAVAGVQQIAEELGGLKTFNAADPRIAEFAAQKTLKVTTINGTMVDSLRTTLMEGMSKAETTAELQARVRHNFGVSRSSALRIARTEAGQSVQGARQIAMEGEGVERTEWISSRDHLVRESHNIDGEVRPLGERFSNGLRYPGDVDGAAGATINCRCTSTPVQS